MYYVYILKSIKSEIYYTGIDKTPLSVKIIGELYGIDGRTLSRQYKTNISDFREWICNPTNKTNTQNIVTHSSNNNERETL